MLDEMLTTDELARRAGVATAALRYWEKLGVLPAPDRISESNAAIRTSGRDRRPSPAFLDDPDSGVDDDHSRRPKRPTTRRRAAHLHDIDAGVALTDVILTEILDGLRGDQTVRRVDKRLSAFDVLRLRTLDDFRDAAAPYRRAPQRGQDHPPDPGLPHRRGLHS